MIKRSLNLIAKIIESNIIERKVLNNKLLKERINEFNYDITFLLDNESERKIIKDANFILQNWFQIYDYPPYKKDNIEWSTDPISNITTKKKPHINLISSTKLIDKVDIKNFWEQSNQHWLVTLGQAYKLTKNEEYARKIIELILDWSNNNKPATTVNWKSTMDVSIRLCNWILALSLIEDSDYFRQHIVKIYSHIQIHILFIYHNLENKTKYTNNHYISNLVGLIWGSTYLIKKTELKFSFDKYLHFGIEELFKELKKQVFENGYDYEMSTYYHCFVTELILHTVVLLENNSIEYPREILSVLKRMISICGTLGAFESNMPLIGDQDSSRLFHLKGCFNIDRCDFSDIREFMTHYNLGLNRSKNEKIQVLSESGIYILMQDNIKSYIRCGAIGTNGKGTHDHNDHLSYTLHYSNIPILIDPGTGYYTKDTKIRKKLRSTKMHNTVSINNVEQNNITETFKVLSNNESKCINFSEDKFEGRFDFNDNITHFRNIHIKSSTFQVTDLIESRNKQNIYFKSHLICPVSLEEIKVAKNVISFNRDNILVEIDFKQEFTLKECEISTHYGKFTKGCRIDTRNSGNNTEYEVRILQL